MNLKELKEKRSTLVSQMKTIVDKCEVETRSLDEAETLVFNELTEAINDLDLKIKEIKEEKRSQEPITVVENKIEERGMKMEKNLQTELRGIESYLRREDTEELRALDTTNSGIVPTHLHGEIIAKLHETAPLFAKTRLFTPINGKLDIVREDNVGDASWIGENQPAPGHTEVKLSKVTLNGKRAVATITVSQSLINDSGIDLANYVFGLLQRRLGRVLNNALITGNGVDQPEGILSAPAECQVTSASKTAITFDDILDLYNSVNPEYLAGACFTLGRKEFNKLSKVKYADGTYVLTADMVAGNAVGYKMLGLPVHVSEVMPENTGKGGEKVVALVNPNAAIGSLISKGMEFKTIGNDSAMSLAGQTLCMLEMYVDSKIINNGALRVLVTPNA